MMIKLVSFVLGFICGMSFVIVTTCCIIAGRYDEEYDDEKGDQ